MAPQAGKREDANFLYRTGAAVYFPSPHYEKVLFKVAEKKGIDVALKEDLVKVDHMNKTATFVNMDSKKQSTIEVRVVYGNLIKITTAT